MNNIGSNGEPKGRLVLVGSIVMDVLLYVDHLPDHGSDVLASQCHISPGGGFNVLNAARQLGMKAAYGGIIGTGRWASGIQDALSEYDIDRLAVLTSEGDNGFVVGMVEPTGERTFITYPGCESMLQDEHLVQIEDKLQDDDTIYISGYEFLYPVSGPLLSDWIVHASQRWNIVIDPGPLVGELHDKSLVSIISACSLLTLNLKEAETLLYRVQEGADTQSGMASPFPADLEPSVSDLSTSPTDLEPSVSDLEPSVSDLSTSPADLEPSVSDLEPSVSELSTFPADLVIENATRLAKELHEHLRKDATLIVRAGKHGCVIVPGTSRSTDSMKNSDLCRAPAVVPSSPSREVIDTTGAGDVHTAAYLAGLAYGATKTDAAWIANVAASMSVERLGGASCPSIAEIDNRLNTQ